MIRPSSVVLVALLLAGCGAEHVPPSPSSQPASGLLGALAGVRATDESSVLIEYGDVALIRAQAAEHPVGSLKGFGYSELYVHHGVLPDLVGFDPTQATTALRVGQPPTWAGVLRMDVDVAAVDAKLAALGARRADSGAWITAEDGGIDPDGALARAGIVTGFQQVRVAEDAVTYAGTEAALKWVTEPAGDRSLAADPMIAELARCLGDVSAAVISKPKGGLPVAAGARTKGGELEVVCVPDENPNALKDRVRTNLEGGTWSDVLPDAAVGLPEGQTGMVRVLAPTTPTDRVGRAMMALERGDLPTLFR